MVARVVFGREREREQRRGNEIERDREVQGGAWRSGEIQGDGDAGRHSGGGRGACWRAAATRSAYWPREEDDRKEEVG